MTQGPSLDDIFNSVGFMGGVILAGALVPQIYLAHKRKSTKDISYMWQGVYSTGLTTVMIYYAYFELWPVFCPVAVELACILYLTALKIYQEKVVQPVSAAEEILGGGSSGYDSIVEIDLELQRPTVVGDQPKADEHGGSIPPMIVA